MEPKGAALRGERSRSREKETRSLWPAESAAERSSPEDFEIPAVGASGVAAVGGVPVILRAPPGPLLAIRRAAAPAAAALAALVANEHLPLQAKTTAVEAEGEVESRFPFFKGRQASMGSAATRAQSPEAEAAREVSGGRPLTVPTPRFDEEEEEPEEEEKIAATALCPLLAWFAPATPPVTAATSSSPVTFSRPTSSLSGDPSKGSVSVAATAKQFLATAGLETVPTAFPKFAEAAPTSPAPALPAATTGRKVGRSHAKRSKSAAMSS